MANSQTLVSSKSLRRKKIAELRKKIATKEYMHMAIIKIAQDLTQRLCK